jgi:hypothetical protein
MDVRIVIKSPRKDINVKKKKEAAGIDFSRILKN